jgi:hypothetical protein
MATNGKEEEVKPIEFYEDEGHLQKLCDFLRSKEGPPVREAIEMEKRVYYLKGEFLYQILRHCHVDLEVVLIDRHFLKQVKSWSTFWSNQRREPSGRPSCLGFSLEARLSQFARTSANTALFIDPKNEARDN